MQITGRDLIMMSIAVKEPEVLKRVTLTKAKAGIIDFIRRNGNQTVTSVVIARTRGTSFNYASIQLKDLWERGYLERVQVGEARLVYEYRIEKALMKVIDQLIA